MAEFYHGGQKFGEYLKDDYTQVLFPSVYTPNNVVWAIKHDDQWIGLV